jgi:hypothetical protein
MPSVNAIQKASSHWIICYRSSCEEWPLLIVVGNASSTIHKIPELAEFVELNPASRATTAV